MNDLSPTRLSALDIDGAVALARSVEWGDTEGDWRTLLGAGTAFGHRDADGSLVSTGVLCDFGARSTLAKIIVRADLRGHGLGAALVARCLAARAHPEAPTMLIATPLGRRIYQRAGFCDRVQVIGFGGAFSSPARPTEASDFHPRDWPALTALDAEASGCDRTRMLRGRLEQAARAVVVRDRDGLLAGFALGVSRVEHLLVGPVLARSDAVAIELVAALASAAPMPLSLDVPADQSEFIDRLIAGGLEAAEVRIEMALGEVAPSAATRFALAAQAFG